MTQQYGYFTYDEIVTQTDAWIEAIDIVYRKTLALKKLDFNSYQHTLFIGCGSTYYLSMAAASLFQVMTGNLAIALPSSELLFQENGFHRKKILLVAISRSGTTSETLQVVKDFKKRKLGDVIVITNYCESPLSQLGDISISINKGQERSVAQTRSFASMFVAITALSFILSSERELGDYTDLFSKTGNSLIEEYNHLAKLLGEDHSINQVYYLGSGPRYGLANELSLKLKEMSQTVTEAYHFFEFRHGPISMVDEKTLMIGLMSEKAFEQEKAVLDDAAKFGAKIIMIGEKDTDIIFNSGLPENLRHVFYLPVLQLFAYYRSLSFGKNPDHPRNLTAVVELEMNNLIIDD